ncbi:hypothetical protein B9Z19DRAFT_1126367 [Tuber borchii]|uniref:Uncharacterized protein n=1 Tax=Tuber borchii TaxID=42251 RepID=A0A2T6ZT46_TUBBO|nr:hypothetical protein B9Z19DRAFT_1126367 [Tuber borchii]
MSFAFKSFAHQLPLLRYSSNTNLCPHPIEYPGGKWLKQEVVFESMLPSVFVSSHFLTIRANNRFRELLSVVYLEYMKRHSDAAAVSIVGLGMIVNDLNGRSDVKKDLKAKVDAINSHFKKRFSGKNVEHRANMKKQSSDVREVAFCSAYTFLQDHAGNREMILTGLFQIKACHALGGTNSDAVRQIPAASAKQKSVVYAPQ